MATLTQPLKYKHPTRSWHNALKTIPVRKRLLFTIRVMFRGEGGAKTAQYVELELFREAKTKKEYTLRRTLRERVDRVFAPMKVPLEPPGELDDAELLATLLHSCSCKYACRLGSKCLNYGAMFLASERDTCPERVKRVLTEKYWQLMKVHKHLNTMLEHGDIEDLRAVAAYMDETYRNPKYMLWCGITSARMYNKCYETLMTIIDEGGKPSAVPIKECAICFEPASVGEASRPSRCTHTFCKPCLDEWHRNKKPATCPKCRLEYCLTITTRDSVYYQVTTVD